jgi:hypothetical protein
LEVIFVDSDDDDVKLAEHSDDLEAEFSLSSGERKSILIEFDVDEDIDTDDYEMYVKMYRKGDEDVQCVENPKEEVTIDKVELCEDGNVKTSDLEITGITDSKKDNDDKWEWFPGNDIEITLKLENKDYSERDFIVELVMLDEYNKEITFAKDDDDLEEESTIDEGEDDIFEFDFQLDNGLDEGSYTLYAKAYADNDEDICTSLRAEDSDSKVIVNINRVNKKVIVTEVDGPENSKTNSKLSYSATVVNMGSRTEEKVNVIAYSRLLGIKEIVEIDDLGAGEEKTVEFEVEIPLIVKLGVQKILFSTEYEYDEDIDHFRSSSDEDDDKKIMLTLTQGEFEEEENETESPIRDDSADPDVVNETITEEPIVEEGTPETIITGNAIGSSSSVNWIGIIGFIILVAIGVFLFLRKPKFKKDVPIVTPNVTRRYKARLN